MCKKLLTPPHYHPPVPSLEVDLLGPPGSACWAAREDPGVTAGPCPGVPHSCPSPRPGPAWPSWHLTCLSLETKWAEGEDAAAREGPTLLSRMVS